MSDTTDKPAFVPPLDATPTVYSSLDAPPPPFQLKPAPSSNAPEPTRTPAARRLASHPAYRSRPKPRVKPAAVKLEPTNAAPPEAPDERPTADDLRPAPEPLDASNPGVTVAVTVSLLVSVMVFLLAV